MYSRRALLFSILLFIYPAFLAANEIDIVDIETGTRFARVHAVKAGRYQFVPASQLFKELSIPYTKDDLSKRLRLNIPRRPVTITAISPYILVGDEVRQIPINILFRNDEFYIPLKFFLQCVGDVLPFKTKYDVRDATLYIQRRGQNIYSVAIEHKENGTLIRVAVGEKFSQSDIFSSISNGWLYVDFYGGRVDTLNPLPVNSLTKAIRQVVPIQLSSEAARLAFKVSGKIKERQILVNEDPPQVLISLRTREDLSEELLHELEKEREKWKIDVIVIDPGHGGRDPGAISRNGLYEKKVTLSLARQVKKELERRLDVKVILTRDRDRFVPLQQRTKIANQHGGKLLISIHTDSNPHKGLRGHTVYFLGPAKTEEARKVAQFENSVIRYEESQNHYQGLSDAAFILAANAQNAYNKESQDFAALVDKQFQQECKSKSHGVRQAGFYVLYGASMPNILIETAFISNRYDEKRLKSKSFQKSVARAICNAVIAFKSRYEPEP